MPVFEEALYIFARTSDNHIQYRSYNGSSWEDWFDLGETTGNFISQPSAMSWKVKDKFARVDMVAISTSERTVYNRWYDDYETWAPPDDKEWADLGPNVGSAVAMCTPYTYRLDLWTTDQESRNITHTYWNQKSDDDISDAGKDGQTGANGVFFFAGREWDPQPLKPSRSAPAVACRDSKVYHDILFYADDDNALYHASFDNDNGWQTSSAWNGDWVGDPTIFAPSDDPERWEFFGVQGNDEMYHLTWTSGSDGGYSSLTRLGGSIISVPSVVSLDKGVYDVLALGTNGTVQHRHYDGTGWSTDWEDLGVRAHSAPNVGVQGDTVFVAAVTQDNKLKVWSRDNSVKESWKGSLKEEDLGGDLSLDFFTDDS